MKRLFLCVGLAGAIFLCASAESRASGIGFGPLDPELECLALNMYWEARSEDIDDQRAIAHVTLNRMTNPEFPDTVCAVVRQGGEEPLGKCQFSWWCDGLADTPTNPVAWNRALSLAREVLYGIADDNTGGALFFHHRAIDPGWIGLEKTVQLGAHIFYR